ncbi:putative WRKY transcription factor 38, partial [Bienertia sinuspersici]
IIKSFDNCISILNSNIETSSSSQIRSLRETLNHAPDSHALGNFGQLKSKHPRVKTIEAPNLAPDGYLWRKYGRKPILHTKHPREYYRCAYRDDQNCQATKHVQMISNNPINYKIIYYSNHSCQPDLHNDNISHIQNMLDNLECTNLISFESKNPTTNHMPKQVLKSKLHVSSPLNDSNNATSSMVPLTHDINEDQSNLKFDCSTTMLETSSIANDMDSLKQTDVVYSPNYYMGSTSNVQVEDYSTLATRDEQYYNFDGALRLQLQDIPFLEDDHLFFS